MAGSRVLPGSGRFPLPCRQAEAAAFCIGWPDERNLVGLLEPVGTHPDFQRRGLGRAVILEALRQLQERGMREATVSTPETNSAALHLYRSLGFRPYTVFQCFTRTLQPTG